MRSFFGRLYAEYVKPILNHINPDVESSKAAASNLIADHDGGKNTRGRSSSVSDMESGSGSGKESDASELGPAFALEAPTDTGIDDMLEVIQHPTRSKILDALAAKTLTTENLEFIRAVLAFDDESQEALVMASGIASDQMKEKAEKLYAYFVQQNCEKEVNVSSSTRVKVEKALKRWYVHYSHTHS